MGSIHARNEAQQADGKAPLHRLNIGPRLTLCFAFIILAMLVGNAVLLWQFQLVRGQATRLRGVDQELILVLQAHANLMAFYERLDALAHTEDTARLVAEAEGLRGVLLDDSRRTREALHRLAAEVHLDPTLPPSLDAIQAALPGQLETITVLARSGDWGAVRLRLAFQVRELESSMSALVANIDHEVNQERTQAVLNIDQAQRRILFFVPVTAVLTLLFAGLLGLGITRSITEPLGKLMEGAAALAAGDFAHRVPAAGKDEIGRLGTVFNEMIVRLQGLYREAWRRETYLAEAQQLSHTGSFGWQVASGKIYWSRETFRIFELDPSLEPTLARILERVHPEDRQVVQRLFDSAQERKDIDFEHRLLMADGSVKYLRVIGHPSTSDESHDLEYVGAVTDVTRRKQAERKFRGLLESAPDAMVVMNPQGRIVLVNAQVEKLFGYLREELVGREVSILVPEPSPGRQSESRAGFFASPWMLPAEGLEVCGRRKNGTEFPVEISLSPLETEEGTLISAAVRDITERKRAEQELQQLVDLVPQVIVVLAPDGKWLHANRVAREYTGLTLEEYRSVDVIDRVIHPDDAGRMRAVRSHGLSGTEPFEIDTRLLGKDGVYRWFLFRYNPLVEQSSVRRWYGTATEIDARKQEEERVRKENVRLEERTRLAQELHDTLLQTFFSASMQLRVAMEGIPADSPVKPRLNRVHELMNRGIEEGRTTIRGLRSSDSRTLDLLAAFSQVRQELGISPEIDFRVNVLGAQRSLLPPIAYEVYRIGREALVNAFCHSQAARIECELEYAESGLRVEIRDNGCGIDAKVLYSGREGHWGLAGMRERANRMGGLLQISSHPSTGTSVQLLIPASVAFPLSAVSRG